MFHVCIIVKKQNSNYLPVSFVARTPPNGSALIGAGDVIWMALTLRLVEAASSPVCENLMKFEAMVSNSFTDSSVYLFVDEKTLFFERFFMILITQQQKYKYNKVSESFYEILFEITLYKFQVLLMTMWMKNYLSLYIYKRIFKNSDTFKLIMFVKIKLGLYTESEDELYLWLYCQCLRFRSVSWLLWSQTVKEKLEQKIFLMSNSICGRGSIPSVCQITSIVLFFKIKSLTNSSKQRPLNED